MRYGTSLVVEWLRLHTPKAGSLSSIPGQGTRSRMPQPKNPTNHKMKRQRNTQQAKEQDKCPPN